MRLYHKLLLVFVPLTAISGLSVGYYATRAVHTVLLDDLRERAERKAAPLARELRPGLASRSERLLLPALQRSLASVGAVYAAAVDPDGEILSDTDVTLKGRRVPDSDRPSARAVAFRGEPVLEVTAPVWEDADDMKAERFVLEGRNGRGRRLGALKLGLPLTETLSTQRRIAVAVLIVVLLGGGATLVVVAFFVRGILSPVQALADAVARIGRGEYGTTVPVRSRDEVGNLASRFNQMSEDLARTTVSKEYLSAIFDSTLDALFIAGVDGRVELVNTAALALTGRAKGELIGLPVGRLFAPEPRLGQERNAELTLKTKSGALVPVLVSSSPLAASREGGFVCIAKDITDRKKAEEAEVLRERDAIQKAVIATVSHELRTPITAIKGFAETLLNGGLDDHENRDSFVKTIQRNADRLCHLVENLLASSVLETGRRKLNREPVELESFARDFVATLEPLARRAGVSLSIFVEPGLTALADPGQLSQVLQNLLDNAVKFSPRGGTVAFVAGRRGDEAILSVKDSGIGIAADDLPHIFERFRRADSEVARRIRGTGLGLSIVKQVVELHGGKIWVESVEGSGATFHFTLPLAVPRAVA